MVVIVASHDHKNCGVFDWDDLFIEIFHAFADDFDYSYYFMVVFDVGAEEVEEAVVALSWDGLDADRLKRLFVAALIALTQTDPLYPYTAGIDLVLACERGNQD